MKKENYLKLHYYVINIILIIMKEIKNIMEQK